MTRIDTRSIRAAGCGTQGVKLLDLENQDKVPAALVIPAGRGEDAARGRDAVAVKYGATDTEDVRGEEVLDAGPISVYSHRMDRHHVIWALNDWCRTYIV